MQTIKLYSGKEIPATIDTTQRIFQISTFDGQTILCNIQTAKEMIYQGEAKTIKHYWNNKFTTIGKKEVLTIAG